jgi:hypothetical protein
MTSSFISERSAELILVPALIKGLSLTFPKITPIYYWASREGARTSANSFVHIPVKVLVLYARRPKVRIPGSGYIQIKFNQLLFDRSSLYNAEGMPVIAGVPLADSLQTLLISTTCTWFEVRPDGYEYVCDIPLNLKENISCNGCISMERIAQMINEAKWQTWNQTLSAIKRLRSDKMGEFSRWPLISGDLYKPVYLIIHGD